VEPREKPAEDREVKGGKIFKAGISGNRYKS
jgi:hypothetical protein